ncbi:MAG: hypothetical protein IH597_10180 [Bacteroidales bacterium]|nr:hypothetical protein [Bacteroidales bacterium]
MIYPYLKLIVIKSNKKVFKQMVFIICKHLLLLQSIAIILLSCSNITEKADNDWVLQGLKGEVKSIREVSYEANMHFGTINQGVKKRENPFDKDRELIFDRKGRIINDVYYEDDGNVFEAYKYTFNEEGKLVEQSFYNSDGNIESIHILKYDEKGQHIETIFSDSNGQIRMTNKNVYNESGKLIEELWLDSTKNITSMFELKYDIRGNIIEKIWYGHDSNLVSKWTYTYDDTGILIEENQFGPNGKRYNIKTYDQNGNKIEESSYAPNGSLRSKVSYIYDQNGNKIEESSYAPNGIISAYKYELDQNGNWYRQIKYENEMPKYIVDRVIEYYD